MKPPQKIVVRMPNWIGDLVMGTAVLKDLRTHFPEAEITAMCQSNVAPLLLQDLNIDELFSYHKPNGWIHHTHPYAIVQALKQREFDLGILLTNSLSSAWWFWLGNVEHRIGFATKMRSWLLTQPILFPQNRETQHLVITYKALLEPLGIEISDTTPTLYVSTEEDNQAKTLLQRLGVTLDQNVLVGINPGAAYGSAKCWPPERFTELTHLLLKDPKTYILYFGDQGGADLVNAICAQMPDRVINLASKTSIRELMALIKCCHLLLTNDSGPMHIADALGVPLVALFGSTSDIKTGPYSGGTVICKHVSCAPCYKRICPIDFRCMKQIEVQEVYEKLKKIIEDPASGLPTRFP